MAKDNCAGVVKATTKDKLTYNTEGQYIITWLYEDGNGNSTKQQQKVIVKSSDKLSPVLKTLPDVVGECEVTVTTVPQASQNCGGFINGKTTSPLTYDKQGAHTIVWKYDDGNGHIIEQQQRIIVKDATAPVPALKTLPDIVANCSIDIKDIPVARDNCAGVVKASTKDKLTYNTEGQYIITWLYEDGNGNSTKQQQKVIVKSSDKLSPVLKTLPDVVGECEVTVTTVPQASQNCGGFINGKTTSPLTYDKQGVHTIVWKYDDGNGHIIEQQQRIIVKDATAPVPAIKTLPDIVANCSIDIKDIPVARDNCAGVVKATTKDKLTYNTEGQYILTWLYEDGNGNGTKQQQKVIVKRSDKLSPVLETLPDVVAECSVTVTNIPQAAKNCGGFVKAATNDPLVYDKQGEYTIRWTYNDGTSNIQQTQKVIIKDKTPPIPLVKELPVITGDCKITVTSIPQASDNCTGTIKATTKDPLIYSKPGTYTINWTFEDGRGNKTIQQQKVNINENEGGLVPLRESLPDIEGTCSVAILVKPMAKDKCLGTVIAKTTDPLYYTEPGRYIIRWKFTGSYDSVVQEQKVIVQDISVNVKIFPNPAENQFSLIFQSCKADQILTVQVFDALGKMVETNTVKANHPMNFGIGYPSGTYFIRIKRGEEWIVKKLLKM